MEFVVRGRPASRRIAAFPGAWNPPTRAHLEIAAAALDYAEEIVFVLPREFPHKQYEGLRFETRIAWLGTLACRDPGFAVAVSDGGLFIDIARECHAATKVDRIYLLCGRDAAERIVGWDYIGEAPIERQLEEYELLVAPRSGFYVPPPHLAERVHALRLRDNFDDVSSTEVRSRILRGEPWEHLVPEEILDRVRDAYVS